MPNPSVELHREHPRLPQLVLHERKEDTAAVQSCTATAGLPGRRLSGTLCQCRSQTGKSKLSTSTEALAKGLALLLPDKACLVRDLLLPFKVVEKQVSAFGASYAEHLHPLTGRSRTPRPPQ
jgi:hypothetical protein